MTAKTQRRLPRAPAKMPKQVAPECRRGEGHAA